MIDTDVLTTIAEISMSFAGLSGIVAVFLSRGRIHPLDAIRFVFLIGIALLNTSAALVPIWLSRSTDDVETIWRVSAGISMAVAAVFGVVNRAAVRKFAITEQEKLNPYFRFLIPSLIWTSLTLWVVNLAGWPLRPNATVHEVGLLLGLAIMAANFIGLVLVRPHEADEP